MTGLRWRIVLVSMAVLWCTFLTVANFVPKEKRVASPLLPDEGMRLGLDLQGGIHWVLGVKLDQAEEQELDFLRQNLEEVAKEGEFALESAKVEGHRLLVVAPGDREAEKVREWAKRVGSLAPQIDADHRFEYSLSEHAREGVRKRGMDQVLEVLRERITDPLKGIADSVVTRQGNDRVLVQIPGGQVDRESLRKLVRSTGFLEFKIVKDSAKSEELLHAKYPNGLPENTMIVTERDKETNRVLDAYLVSKTADITGQYLTDARVNFDRQQRPIVEFRFSSEGGQIFSELTGANLRKQLAIVLDGRVYSAPSINSRIGSSGQIEGRFTMQEAADLAVVLRSGSLPLTVVIEEERSIGPALGADSIRHGAQASIASLLAVLVFAVLYYRLSGVYATVAIAVGMITILGLMAMSRATLTMPGIAGLVLTIGMAIDGNVLIFERIREELRRGVTPRAAIKAGFNRALYPILDGHITAMITALVLYEYGTGPIKGFAVTLALGLVATVFQAVIVNRMLFAIYPGERHVTELSI